MQVQKLGKRIKGWCSFSLSMKNTITFTGFPHKKHAEFMFS